MANFWSSSPPLTPQSPLTPMLSPPSPQPTPILSPNSFAPSQPWRHRIVSWVSIQQWTYAGEKNAGRTQEYTGINLTVCRCWTKLLLAQLRVAAALQCRMQTKLFWQSAEVRKNMWFWLVSCCSSVDTHALLGGGTQDAFSSSCFCHFPFWLEDSSL